MRAIAQSPVETACIAVIAACAASAGAHAALVPRRGDRTGLSFALRLIPTTSGRRSLSHKETRS